MTKRRLCQLCGVDIVNDSELSWWKVTQPGVCRGTTWQRMHFPEIPVGEVIECHTGCAEVWDELEPVAGAQG